MIKGFVFGKFMPFHKGHEAMINFARTHCDELTVLICCSDQEPIPAEVRREWLEKTYVGIPKVSMQVYTYRESEFPNTSVSSVEVSEVWARQFKKLLPEHTLLVTSEPYGEFVADFMKIRHLPFNPERSMVPVSASLIRSNVAAYWSFLPDAVKSYFCKKVVLLGTESTGKTTLATQLAEHFRATLVTEAARDIIADSQNITLEDLQKVAAAHAASIAQATTACSPLLILDTDVHITQSYARHYFGQEMELADEIYQLNQADLYLYLNKDVPFVQDGTRLTEDDRNAMDIAHRLTLQKYGICYHELSGDWEDKYNQAIALVRSLISSIS